jgi:branched-chain amino acid transport system ATP-binding protein
MSALLDLQDVHAAYGLSRVLFGISIEVNEGECVCLLGRNGVGKTTTMRSVMGLTPPSAGHVRFKSRDITGWPPPSGSWRDKMPNAFLACSQRPVV